MLQHMEVYFPTSILFTFLDLVNVRIESQNLSPAKLNQGKERNKYQVNWFITIFMVYLTAFDISDFIVFFFKWSGLLGKFTYRKILNRNILHEHVLVG